MSNAMSAYLFVNNLVGEVEKVHGLVFRFFQLQFLLFHKFDTVELLRPYLVHVLHTLVKLFDRFLRRKTIFLLENSCFSTHLY